MVQIEICQIFLCLEKVLLKNIAFWTLHSQVSKNIYIISKYLKKLEKLILRKNFLCIPTLKYGALIDKSVMENTLEIYFMDALNYPIIMS